MLSHIELDATKIPISLHRLIPLAERWGIIDDLFREQSVALATPEEIAELKTAVHQHEEELESWLAGPAVEQLPFSVEYLAFSAMVMAADFG